MSIPAIKPSKITATFMPTMNLKKQKTPIITAMKNPTTTANTVKSARNSAKLVSNFIPPC